ncbi:hypothetical protein VSAK1_02139, partial [Vibrio mediterranei AK1]|uniref:hypothetical protein n=1 Tax=Vibrio mediterranei TaxID=689 RepID=UPI0001541F15
RGFESLFTDHFQKASLSKRGFLLSKHNFSSGEEPMRVRGWMASPIESLFTDHFSKSLAFIAGLFTFKRTSLFSEVFCISEYQKLL